MKNDKYRFTLERYVPKEGAGDYDWDEVSSSSGRAPVVLAAMVEAIGELAEEAGLPNPTKTEEVSTADFRRMLDDPMTKSVMGSMFGPDMLEGLGKMADLVELSEKQPGKAGQS
jgi:hypothetical protein